MVTSFHHQPEAQKFFSYPQAAGRLPHLSGGAFNRSVQHQSQSIGRGFEAQGLSRALIEPQRN